MNSEKTQTVIMTTKIANQDKKTVKFLGVTLNSNLEWENHIYNMSGILSSAIYAIRRMKNISTTEAALTTFHAYFMSRATYAILVWGASSHANRVFIQQKEAIRAVTGSSYRSSCRELFKSLKVLTIPSIYILTAVGTVCT